MDEKSFKIFIKSTCSSKHSGSLTPLLGTFLTGHLETQCNMSKKDVH